MASFITNVCAIQDGFFSPGILWREWVLYPFDRNKTQFANESLDWFERRIGPHMASLIPVFR